MADTPTPLTVARHIKPHPCVCLHPQHRDGPCSVDILNTGRPVPCGHKATCPVCLGFGFTTRRTGRDGGDHLEHADCPRGCADEKTMAPARLIA